MDIEQELFELPQKVSMIILHLYIVVKLRRDASQERVSYNKEVQTMAYEEESKAAGPSEGEIRERILREREAAEAERIKELDELSEQLDKEIEMEIRGSLAAYDTKY